VSGGGNYADKARPVVVVQDDAFDATISITVCAFTTDPTEAPLFRVEVLPSVRNGLRQPSRLMVDKITTVAKAKIGTRIGWLEQEHMRRLDRAMLVFLGLAGSSRTGRASTSP
jgi:mRNA interferase MazF